MRLSYESFRKLYVPIVIHPIVCVRYDTRRLGDSHVETDSARELLARNLRLQLREDEAKEIERVRSWSKYITSCGFGSATKRNRDDSP